MNSASQDKIQVLRGTYYCYLANWPLQPDFTLNIYIYIYDLCCFSLLPKKFLFAVGSFNAETLLLVKALRIKTSQCSAVDRASLPTSHFSRLRGLCGEAVGRVQQLADGEESCGLQMWHGCDSHQLTAAVVACTRSS